jgi:hypothetical protein
VRPLLTPALVGGVLVGGALVAGLLLTGCTAEDPVEKYCDRVEAESATLTRTVDEGGRAGLLRALPTLEGLAEDAPKDVTRSWRVLLDAVRGLRDALDDAGLEPDQVDGDLPPELPADQRRAIEDAAIVMASPDTLDAADEVDQHARDVCHTPLL